MKIGVISADITSESRVAITPDAVKKLRKLGFEVVIQSGAGQAAYYADELYQAAGADIASSRTEVITQSKIITTVNDLPAEATESLSSGQIVIGMLDPYRNTQLDTYAAKGATVFAMELLPRTLSRAQNMDVLSSQANLAGYKAVLLAANEYSRPFPMFMTSAGTVKPAKVVILGVGVAGLQAIATAKRLGAVVEASDLRPTAREQVESLGGKWLDVPMSAEEAETAKSTGGYAWTPSEQYVKDQAAVVDKALSNADIIITTAQIPGRNAPRLVHGATLAKMKAGSVLIDMAAGTGGNVEGSVPNETITTDNGVRIVGAANIPSMLAAQSSDLYANNLVNFITTLIAPTGDDASASLALNLDMEDEIQGALAVTHDSQVRLAKR
ncbi:MULTISPECIES: Re/Si-specific NAD(P)(+) transhydrogenase subunit alpha [unclassified Psychrobacter]|uniref:Re/Si-specific NAD(P)(+) transhydrogenase subunit alpha n=1 Tax=unclassified Psychrobacter TaxID=196806 RepID=UPI00086E0CAE|nr:MULTISPECIES: Re/Si-specific NAD(P)(+) transhydrogenase subunit alpha [unclassified Psychrobacter]MBA6243686.1 Re/Si-specific NAD(P)(+) transhydrogenase subunit alpha [Psychrobacter sp. Urea-trap-18]MBA6286830.1 Re/Si-specific NAD(P)(+) transhydrogenase subunit alpha [Psychrobacter sp. Urea-trap-16]MBA6317455.1 Re/Si-specific NAD(P)(+) transhydrogenase subunit alpha [Psychrobacter sp. Urea-trap-20]MBA6333310.1 Re/Si-specific NAD(P)(+) transhydrogenase subunit alpha [Psychrobacter sp. Urea-tr|tara:strand:- start:8772 stop:9923 length:1152 start_codon:yes stop_codon:yes gene_type:complete